LFLPAGKNMKRNICIFILLLIQVLGCATMPVFMDRSSVADDIAGKAGFTKEYIKAGQFMLMTYQRFNRSSDSINIYIEGDGRAWETKHRLSDDPTPLNPVALRLAAVDPSDNIAYIARPGQYSLSGLPECDSKYWSGSRFAPEVINSFGRAIDLLKGKSLAHHVQLIGFSGGGAIAVFVAAQRSDVTAIRTVAGDLDPKAFCQYHHVSRLEGSMDPMGVAQAISLLPQRHFVGSKDLVVPGFIAQSFVKKEGDRTYGRITVVEGNTHTKGWQERWKELLSLPPL
jgi:hypothetical protein